MNTFERDLFDMAVAYRLGSPESRAVVTAMEHARALAAATGTAKTPKAVECEASQSGPAEQGNAQPLPPSKDSDNHG